MKGIEASGSPGLGSTLRADGCFAKLKDYSDLWEIALGRRGKTVRIDERFAVRIEACSSEQSLPERIQELRSARG